MGKKQCIEDIILTSPTGAINQIKGDKTEVMKAILFSTWTGFD